MISESAKRKILGLTGLGIRGRLAVVGVEQVRDAARRGRLKIALVASDASQNSLNKVESLLTAKKVRIIREFSGRDLGHVSGREIVAVIGVSDAGLAQGITKAISAESRR